MEVQEKITVLCVQENSIYKTLDVDWFDKTKDAYNFTGSNPVITHAPCGQWSRLKTIARSNPYEKELAWFCLDKVIRNGGIFEHPAYSSFFKEAGIKPTISVDQFWFGYPAKKPTWLFFSKCKPLPTPLRFDMITKKVENIWSTERSTTTKQFALWMIESMRKSGL